MIKVNLFSIKISFVIYFWERVGGDESFVVFLENVR